MPSIVTITGITGGESLTNLDFIVLDGQDLGDAATIILKQGNSESTDANGDLEIDLDGTGVSDGDPLLVIIGDWTSTPGPANNVAVCYADAVVT